MICIVSGTNRLGSNSLKIAQYYLDVLERQGAEARILDLAQLPQTVAFTEAYGQRSDSFTQDFISPVDKADKFVFVVPEYNGGFPGILKVFIDCVPPALFHHKKAGLVGLSSGASGASRPMDQLSNVLNYLQVDVIAAKPKLSSIENMLDAQGQLIDNRCIELLDKHAGKMIKF